MIKQNHFMLFALVAIPVGAVCAFAQFDPLSQNALEDEELFFHDIENDLKKSEKSSSPTMVNLSSPEQKKPPVTMPPPPTESAVVKKLEDKKTTSPYPNEKEPHPVKCEKTKKDKKAVKNTPIKDLLEALSAKEKKNAHTHNKELIQASASSHKMKVPYKETKEPFCGAYFGFSGSVVHPYVEAELWSKKYRPIIPQEHLNLSRFLVPSEVDTIYYGSYAYNNNTWLLNGAVFGGYDVPIAKILRFGIEIQGGATWHEMEITANGVYAERSSTAIGGVSQTVLPSEFLFKGRGPYTEIDQGFTRQTVRFPYVVAVLPRLGIMLLKHTLLYTKLGFSYSSVQVKDHPETIEPCVDVGRQKKEADTIYNVARASVLGGIGLEAIMTKQLFVRMECLFAKSGGVHFTSDILQNASNVNNSDRQLDNLDIKSIKNFSVGFGAGLRF